MSKEKNCFSCNNAIPAEIQDTICICKVGKGDKIGDNYWVNAINHYGCGKYQECEE